MTAGRVGDLLRSARARILGSILLVTLLGMTIAGGAAYLVQRETALRHIDERLQATVQSLQLIADGGDGDEPSATVEALLTTAMQRVLPDRNESVVGIVDGQAALVPSSGLTFRLDADPEFISLVVSEADTQHLVMGTSLADAGWLRYVVIPVAVDGDSATGLYVAAYSIDAELELINGSSRTYAVLAALSLLVIALVGWFVAGRLLRPIRLLRNTAEHITATDLSGRIPVVGNDDVSELAHTVNRMLARLEQLFTGQQRLLDDVSHELKTPITIVRGHLELLEAGDEAELEKTRGIAIDELDRMSTLVGDITLLARTRSPGSIEAGPIDVAELTRSVFEKARMLSANHIWRLAPSRPMTAQLDEDRITQAWLQLAENAAKYAPAGTVVEIGSNANGRDVDLWVRDEGPGIPVEQLQTIFDRFTRAHQGRGVEGSGLGLSIVAAIAEAHGGQAFASAHQGGALFTIRIPTETSAESPS